MMMMMINVEDVASDLVRRLERAATRPLAGPAHPSGPVTVEKKIGDAETDCVLLLGAGH